MSSAFTWKIDTLECIPRVENMDKYVVAAHWHCVGMGEKYAGQYYGSTTFSVDPNKTDFVPYDSITPEMAISWVQEALGEEQVAAVYGSIETQIKNQIDPPVVSYPLPPAF